MGNMGLLWRNTGKKESGEVGEDGGVTIQMLESSGAILGKVLYSCTGKLVEENKGEGLASNSPGVQARQATSQPGSLRRLSLRMTSFLGNEDMLGTVLISQPMLFWGSLYTLKRGDPGRLKLPSQECWPNLRDSENTARLSLSSVLKLNCQPWVCPRGSEGEGSWDPGAGAPLSSAEKGWEMALGPALHSDLCPAIFCL